MANLKQFKTRQLLHALLLACLAFFSRPGPAGARVVTFDRSLPNGLDDNRMLEAHLHEMVDEELGSRSASVSAQISESASNNKSGQTAYTPVVLWHGMGDTAYGAINVNRLAIQKELPGIKVFSVQIGDSSIEDEMASYFSNANKQIEQVCNQLLHNPDVKRAGAINAIGFSQGSQFLRGLVQRCPLRESGIRMRNLITLGGQHQGVYGLPRCDSKTFCDYIRFMLNEGAYQDYVQQHLVQAEYWHDPLNEAHYKEKNIFLADINNERQVNETYKANLLTLDNLVLVQFAQDEMVVPRNSSLFGFYEPGQKIRVRPLEESPLYLEDRLGLKRLDESGRLKRLVVPGKHLQYNIVWFLEEIVRKYLKN